MNPWLWIQTSLLIGTAFMALMELAVRDYDRKPEEKEEPKPAVVASPATVASASADSTAQAAKPTAKPVASLDLALGTLGTIYVGDEQGHISRTISND